MGLYQHHEAERVDIVNRHAQLCVIHILSAN